MAYADYLRQHVRVEQQVAVNDGRLGTTTTWLALTTVRCRSMTLSSHQNAVYQREGFTNVIRLFMDDRLPMKIDGKISLYGLLTAESETRYRFVLDGKVVKPISINYQSLNMHDYAQKQLIVDVDYDVEDVGYIDS